METKYDINQILYLPFSVNGIEIKPYGHKARIVYTLTGKSAATGTSIIVTEENLNTGIFQTKISEDFI